MKYTSYLKLKKPDRSENAKVQDLNDNMDAIDGEFKRIVNIKPGTGDSFSYDELTIGSILIVNSRADSIFVPISNGGSKLTMITETHSGIPMQGIRIPGYSCIPIPIDKTGLTITYLESRPLIHSKSIIEDTTTGTEITRTYYKIHYTLSDNNSCGVVLLDSDPICLTGDTLITMYNGTQKRIDEVEIGDVILSFDFINGKQCANTITRTDKREKKAYFEWHKYTLSDGTVLKVVHTHAFYSEDEQQFKFIDYFRIGERIRKQNGTSAALVSSELITENVYHYTIAGEQTGSIIYANGCLAAEWQGIPS